MTELRVGVLAAELSAIDRLRPDDAIDVLVLRHTLLDMPRAGVARRLGERIQTIQPKAEVVLYAWHLVTHSATDPLPQRGARTIAGQARGFGHLADTPEVEEAWAATRRAVEAIGAKHAILRTPPGFAPGARGRGRLERFVRKRQAEGIRLVWEAEGLWTDEERIALARDLDIQLLAPMPEPPTDLHHRWICVGAGGAPAALGPDQALMLADELDAVEGGPLTVVFAGPVAIKNLRSFQRIWRSSD